MKLYGLLLVLPLLTACMSMKNVKELPPELLYQPPAGASATITGNMEPRFTALVGDRVAYINDIDGKRVPKAKKQIYEETWNTVYPLIAGEHNIRVRYSMGGHYTQPTVITFTAEANKDYQLGFVTDIGTSWFSKNSYADIWIEDKATGESVSEVVRTTPPPAPRTISYPVIINN